VPNVVRGFFKTEQASQTLDKLALEIFTAGKGGEDVVALLWRGKPLCLGMISVNKT
jgi:hypothetical protein